VASPQGINQARILPNSLNEYKLQLAALLNMPLTQKKHEMKWM
jgi:hypothetical protein